MQIWGFEYDSTTRHSSFRFSETRYIGVYCNIVSIFSVIVEWLFVVSVSLGIYARWYFALYCSNNNIQVDKKPCATLACFDKCPVQKQILCGLWATCIKSVGHPYYRYDFMILITNPNPNPILSLWPLGNMYHLDRLRGGGLRPPKLKKNGILQI